MLIKRFPLREAEGKSGGAGDSKGSASGEGTDDKGESQTGDDKGQRSESVSREAYDRAVSESKKAKARAKELEDEKRSREDASLKEQGKWKEAAERAEKERDDERQRADGSSKLFKNTLISSRILELATAAGLKKEARDDLDLLDLDEVEVDETSSGRYIVRGADKLVEKLKKSKPHWFGDPKPPTFNSGGGKGGGKESTEDAILGDNPAQTIWELEKKYGRKDPRFVKAWNAWMGKRNKKQ